METRHEVTGTVVAFVVAEDENQPQAGVEFDSAEAALNSPEGGCFFKKILLSTGEFSYDPGLHPGLHLGMTTYGQPCSGCKQLTWHETRPVGLVRCENCSGQDFDDIGDVEYYDREY